MSGPFKERVSRVMIARLSYVLMETGHTVCLHVVFGVDTTEIQQCRLIRVQCVECVAQTADDSDSRCGIGSLLPKSGLPVRFFAPSLAKT